MSSSIKDMADQMREAGARRVVLNPDGYRIVEMELFDAPAAVRIAPEETMAERSARLALADGSDKCDEHKWDHPGVPCKDCLLYASSD